MLTLVVIPGESKGLKRSLVPKNDFARDTRAPN